MMQVTRRALLFCVGGEALRAQGPPEVAVLPSAQWPMSKLNARRNSRSTRNGPSSPNLLWTFSDITLQSTITVGWDGTIFAAEADRIIAFFPNGRVRWRKDFPREISLAGCALGADGTLLVVSERGYLLAYWPNGTLRWVHKHPDAYISLHARPLVSADGTVYSGGQTEMVSLRPNGRVNWRFAARTEGEPAQGADGAIYFPSESYLYALNPEGSLRWRTFVTGDYGIGSAPAVAEDGTIYVTTVLGSLAAVNPNGSMKWMFPRSGGVADVPTPPALGADGTIYYGATDNYFYAVNPDGSEKWRFRPDSRSGFHYAPATVGGDGTIYVGANVPDFYALKPDGSVRWHFQVPYDPFLGTYVRSQPVLVEAGRLLIGSLFALQALGPEPA